MKYKEHVVLAPEQIIKEFQESGVNLVRGFSYVAQSQAGTEAESSKDYTGRVVFEFFQNAIDRASENVWLVLTKDEFVIFNDGKEFSIYDTSQGDKNKASDFHALNTIHNSNKKAGESIGNKGVGFKSCWNVSNHVMVESISAYDDEPWGFELFNPVKHDCFNDEGERNIRDAIKESPGNIPSFYFPKYKKSSRDRFNVGAVTRVTIRLKDEKSYENIKDELVHFKKSVFVFLNQLKNKQDQKIDIHIEIDNESEVVSSADENWKDVVSLKGHKYFESEYKTLVDIRDKENYENIPKEPNIVIAFPSSKVSNRFDSRFYTYLPTKISCGFNVLIHADFALDNARVTIPDTDYNKYIQRTAAKMLVHELKNNKSLHKHVDFPSFLNPSNNEFSNVVWNELVKDENIRSILEQVFSGEASSEDDATKYDGIFDVINSWVNLQADRDPGDEREWIIYRERIYKDVIKYFCGKDINIVPIGNYLTYLPEYKKDKNADKENKTKKLFYVKNDENEVDYGLLKDLKNIDISSFEGIKRDYFTDRINIVKENSTLEIFRALSNEDTQDDIQRENILKFVHVWGAKSGKTDYLTSESNVDCFHVDIYKKNNSPKNYLTKMLLPSVTGDWGEARHCYFKIDDDVAKSFESKFKKVDYERCKRIFDEDDIDSILLSFGAWRTIPITLEQSTSEFDLPWVKDNLPTSKQHGKQEEFKVLLKNSFVVWEKIRIISPDNICKLYSKVKNQKLFYDKYHDEFVMPIEVFLFNDHIRRNGINQEHKNEELLDLYQHLGIESIQETKSEKKLIKQLNKLRDGAYPRDMDHKRLYRQLVSCLSKLPLLQGDYNIPLLSEKSDEYLDGGKTPWFADRDNKKYKHYYKDLDYVYFDFETKKDFIKKFNIKIFEPYFQLMPAQEITVSQETLKKEIEVKFLPELFCLADDVVSINAFNKDAAISRWNNLIIEYSDDVWIDISLPGVNDKKISIGKDKDSDVLFKPLNESERQSNKENIGRFVHDIKGSPNNVLKNDRFSQFGTVIADGVFRDSRLGATLVNYLASKDKERFLCEKGILPSEVKEMTYFISKSILTNEDKGQLVREIKDVLKLDIEFDGFTNFENYTSCKVSYEKCIKGFSSSKFRSMIKILIENYKKHQIQSLLGIMKKLNDANYLEVLCYKKYKSRDYDEIREKILGDGLFNGFGDELNDDLIFSRLGIEKIDKDDESYINAMLDFKFYIDDVNPVSSAFTIEKVMLTNKTQPRLGNAKKNKESHAKTQEKNEKIGLGQELKISYKLSKELGKSSGLRKEFIKRLQIDIYEGDDGLKSNADLTNHCKEIAADFSSYNDLMFAKKVINIASNNLDGLGYDLLIPEFNDDCTKINKILKVELKSTTRTNNVEIHLSENEVGRIMHFSSQPHNANWRLWVNDEKMDITENVIKEVNKLKENDSAFYSNDYILKLN